MSRTGRTSCCGIHFICRSAPQSSKYRTTTLRPLACMSPLHTAANATILLQPDSQTSKLILSIADCPEFHCASLGQTPPRALTTDHFLHIAGLRRAVLYYTKVSPLLCRAKLWRAMPWQVKRHHAVSIKAVLCHRMARPCHPAPSHGDAVSCHPMVRPCRAVPPIRLCRAIGK